MFFLNIIIVIVLESPQAEDLSEKNIRGKCFFYLLIVVYLYE
jgi:hypothetical protein